ncbi:glycosyltransferase family 2 protein [Thalassospira marina]|uniref:Glycosyl transferase n=1 Tax=Thalassospira marina TaxID=2048283 RepID=A0ABN5FM14_9PROT|nr:glycosyltransferase family 2 protein [Thalassospira marina]AUG54546.1 glycosyl transferase [Thalassospira marina]
MIPSIAVIILTYNEEIHLARALDSVASVAHSIHVIDSGSTDSTCAISQKFGAEILTHPFKNYADQFQWALEHISTNASWILRLDADEIIEPDLAARIRTELPHVTADISGISFDRKHIFLGRFIRHGGRYPLRLLRLFRRGKGRIEQRWMDEHIVVEEGRTVHFSGGFADHNLNDLTYFTDKHNKYATREAVDVLIRRHSLTTPDEALTAKTSAQQAAWKRQIKEKIYNRLPLWIGPIAYFIYRYIWQLGFLDGKEGLIYHGLQGLWYRFLVGAKVEELDLALRSCKDKDKKKEILKIRTGLKIFETNMDNIKNGNKY